MVIRPDEGEGGDWIKPLRWDLPTNVRDFAALFRDDPARIARFMHLPAARAMPEELRAALIEQGFLKNEGRG